MEEDDRPRRQEPPRIGQDLRTLSVEELNDYLAALKAETTRVEAETARRGDVRRSAEALFKPPT